MIVSLPLLLVAVVLAVVGVAQNSGPLLVGSILASLLTAVTLVASARHAAATRLAVGRGGLVIPLLSPPARADDRPAGGEDPYTHADDAGDAVTAVIPMQPRPGDRDAGLAPTGSGPADVDETQVSVAPAEQRTDADDDDPSDEPPVQVVTPEHAAVVAGLEADVVVVDERPRYHLAACVHLIDRQLQVLPVREAVELGFTPCAMCEPDTALLAQAQHSG